MQYPDETKLPGAIPRVITDLAEQWTRSDTTVFDRVMSIQRHLTDLAVYHYDTTVSYAPTMQGLSDFLLKGKSGFCQQFASAMAVMLRSLHIPARVAMGYASGTQITNNTWSVMTTDLHAWVEVPFQGYGWLPFEPTPGKTNPAMETYMSSPSSGRNCEASTGKCSRGGATKKHGGSRGGTTVKGREGAVGNFNNRPLSPGTSFSAPKKVPLGEAVAWLAVAAALVLAGIPLVHWFRRRRKLHDAREPRALILATYDVFSERAADLGFGRGLGETPLEYRRRVEATELLVDGQLERLTGTVVRAAYASRAPSDDDAMDAAADADQVIRDLRRSTPLRRRLFGIYRRD